MALRSWSAALSGALALCLVAPTEARSSAGAPGFSPDGRRLAAACSGLRVVDLQSGAVKTVPASAPAAPGDSAGFVAWSPDGTRLVFVDTAGGSARGARVYDTASGSATRLAGTGGGPFAWREDGRRFASFVPTGEGVTAVWYDMVDRGVALRTPVRAVPSDAIWLPGTDDVVLLASRKGNAGDIYTVEAGEVHQITKTGDVIGFALTADKQKLIWARRSANPRYILFSLYEMDLKERSVRRLAFPERIGSINPDPRRGPVETSSVRFSPDGARLAIVVRLRATPEPATRAERTSPACYVVSRDGTTARLIRRGKATTLATGTLVPAWSVDSQRLALESCTGGDASLWLYAADGSGERALVGH